MMPNNYSGKNAEQVWNEWSSSQRYHFLKDHLGRETSQIYREEIKENIDDWKSYNYSDIPSFVQELIRTHINEGQYGKGGNVNSDAGFWVIRDEKTNKLIAIENGEDFNDESDVYEEYNSLPDHFTVEWSETNPNEKSSKNKSKKKEEGGMIKTIWDFLNEKVF